MRIMAVPPALLTSSPLAILAIPPPLSHKTILPLKSTSFKDPLAHKAACCLPFFPAYVRNSGVGEKSEGWKTDSPSNSCPFPSLAVATMLLSILLAPTVRIQGAPLTKEP
ncbi:hypothetical protein V8G54_014816 [Vigna mungo]|uniref:Uncharacterized protein n=1 Tax=Vigna mungo TaxID=3915 RepID=A0AAQ3NI95_VIGMU